jgi:L-glyceraldehyde 3-phosphate reductase
MVFVAAADRYTGRTYRRSGRSGLKLPAISLGLWQNFGADRPLEASRTIVLRAFDLGVTHFDLANNYGPPYGSAEETFGQILRSDLRPFREELVISTKAGYEMWPGPYGDWGSRKYVLASLDHSLRRLGLEYVDVYYSHRFDPETPLEETMAAYDSAVRQGKTMYMGVANYSAEQTRAAAAILRGLGTPLLIHQPTLPARRAEGFAGESGWDAPSGALESADAGQGPRAGRARLAAGTDARPDGSRLGPARPCRDRANPRTASASCNRAFGGVGETA